MPAPALPAASCSWGCWRGEGCQAWTFRAWKMWCFLPPWNKSFYLKSKAGQVTVPKTTLFGLDWNHWGWFFLLRLLCGLLMLEEGIQSIYKTKTWSTFWPALLHSLFRSMFMLSLLLFIWLATVAGFDSCCSCLHWECYSFPKCWLSPVLVQRLKFNSYLPHLFGLLCFSFPFSCTVTKQINFWQHTEIP